MKAISIISQDVFDKIRSRFENLEMGDENGSVTIDPALARFFDFDFVSEGNNLGRVSISLNDLGTLKIYYSQGITENQDEPAKKIWYNFLREMRFFAMRRLLRFDTRDIAKNNLDKNDFQHLATSQAPKEQDMTNMNESKWNHRSSKKTSRRIQGQTEVIVRHRKQVNEMLPADRSRPGNIQSIFIQNSEGERFKAPFNYLPLAFALAQHIDHGGVPHDAPARKIIGMCEEMAKLQEFKKHVRHSTLHDDALQITERASCRLQELKSQLESLGKRRHYESWIAEFNEQEMLDDDLEELSPAQLEDYRSKFTQKEFNEELTGYFPMIHRLMREKINLEDYANEQPQELDSDIDTVKESEFDKFTEWAEAMEQGKLTDDQIEELKSSIAELPTDSNGNPQLDLETAMNFFNEFGIEDSDLESKLEDMSNVDSTANAMDVFGMWAEDNYPELLVALGMSGTEETPAEPASSEEVPPAPEEPTAENDEMGGFPNDTMSREGMVKEIAETVKKFYNADNEEVAPFRSEESICLEVEKTIREKYGDKASAQAGIIARKFMEKLTKQWEMKHHKHKEELAPASIEDDGLSRLKELVNTIKQKVEGIGDRGHSGTDFNKNIMPAENTEEGMLDKAKEIGKKVLNKIAPDDETYLKQLQKQVGVPQTGKPPMKKEQEMESILKLAGLKK